MCDVCRHVSGCLTPQNDVFTLTAVHLGQLKKVKIRHDNAGIGAAWFLGHIEVEDTKTKIV